MVPRRPGWFDLECSGSARNNRDPLVRQIDIRALRPIAIDRRLDAATSGPACAEVVFSGEGEGGEDAGLDVRRSQAARRIDEPAAGGRNADTGPRGGQPIFLRRGRLIRIKRRDLAGAAASVYPGHVALQAVDEYVSEL